jgi:hypothetical protein
MALVVISRLMLAPCIPTAREEEWIFLPSVDVYLDPKHLNKSHRGSTLTSGANAVSNSAASRTIDPGHGTGYVSGSGSAQGASGRSRAAQASGQGRGVRMGGGSKGTGKSSGQGSEGSSLGGMSMDSVAGWLKDIGLGGYARVRMTTTARSLAHLHTFQKHLTGTKQFVELFQKHLTGTKQFVELWICIKCFTALRAVEICQDVSFHSSYPKPLSTFTTCPHTHAFHTRLCPGSLSMPLTR